MIAHKKIKQTHKFEAEKRHKIEHMQAWASGQYNAAYTEKAYKETEKEI